MKVGIINVTGYAGSELVRILYRHPEVEISSVTGRSQAGQKLGDVSPPPRRAGSNHPTRAGWQPRPGVFRIAP